jgi:hypothetical protein
MGIFLRAIMAGLKVGINLEAVDEVVGVEEVVVVSVAVAAEAVEAVVDAVAEEAIETLAASATLVMMPLDRTNTTNIQW